MSAGAVRVAYVQLTADAKGMKSGFAAAKTNIRAIQGEATRASKAFGGIGASVKGLAVTMGAAFGAAALIGGIKATVNAASDLGETISKTQTIFGDAADGMLSWSGQAASALGLSKRAALDGAAGFAVYAKAAGLTDQETAKFSTGLVKLAADMASFHNANPEDVLLAIKSGLSGEAEPLKAYGILLNEAAVEQEGLRMGLIKTTVPMGQLKKAQLDVADAQSKLTEATRQYGPGSKEAITATAELEKKQASLSKTMEGKTQKLTDQQKVLARQSFIMRNVGAAQGDFARTSGSLANQQRILKAELENMSASVGRVFLPYVLKAVAGLREFGRWLVKVGKSPEFKAGVQEAKNVLQGFREFIGLMVGDFNRWRDGSNKAGVSAADFKDTVSDLWNVLKGVGNYLKEHREIVWAVIGAYGVWKTYTLAVATALKVKAAALIVAKVAVAAWRVTVLAARAAVLVFRAAILAARVAMLLFKAAMVAMKFAAFAAGFLTVKAAVVAYRLALLAARGAMIAFSAGMAVLKAALAGARIAALALNAAFLANPVGLVVIAIAALAAGMVIAYRKSETFRNIVNAVGNALKPLWDMLMKNKQAFLILLGPIGMVSAGLITLWKKSETFRNIVRGALTIVQASFKVMASVAKVVLHAIGGYLSYMWGQVQRAVTMVRQIIHGDWKGAWATFKTILATALIAVQHIVGKVAGYIKTGLSKAASAAWEKAKQVGSDIIAGIVNGIKENAGKVKAALLAVAKDAWDAGLKFMHIKSPSRKAAKEMGGPISQGIAVGILSKKQAVTDAVIITLGAALVAGKKSISTTGKQVDKFAGLTFAMSGKKIGGSLNASIAKGITQQGNTAVKAVRYLGQELNKEMAFVAKVTSGVDLQAALTGMSDSKQDIDRNLAYSRVAYSRLYAWLRSNHTKLNAEQRDAALQQLNDLSGRIQDSQGKLATMAKETMEAAAKSAADAIANFTNGIKAKIERIDAKTALKNAMSGIGESEADLKRTLAAARTQYSQLFSWLRRNQQRLTTEQAADMASMLEGIGQKIKDTQASIAGMAKSAFDSFTEKLNLQDVKAQVVDALSLDANQIVNPLLPMDATISKMRDRYDDLYDFLFANQKKLTADQKSQLASQLIDLKGSIASAQQALADLAVAAAEEAAQKIKDMVTHQLDTINSEGNLKQNILEYQLLSATPEQSTQLIADQLAAMREQYFGIKGVVNNGHAMSQLSAQEQADLYSQLTSMFKAIRDFEAQYNMPAGALAHGGMAHAGKSYLVGERGPELFTPVGTGRVYSNTDTNRMIGGGDTHHHYNVTIEGGNQKDGKKLANEVIKELSRSVPHMRGLASNGGKV